MSGNADVSILPSATPVELSSAAADDPQSGTALCLSGGGYRAMLYHVGSLWRLNELGLLRNLDRISSVSGGSITAAVLGLHWHRLAFGAGAGDVAAEFVPEVVTPIRSLASRTIDTSSILGGIFSPDSIGEKVEDAYETHLFDDATLQNLPEDPPRFVFNATNVQSGSLWRFSKPFMADARVGRVDAPDTKLASVVAASSAFPPFLSPCDLELDPATVAPMEGTDLNHPPFTEKAVLTDGGVYDNLGLETAWKRCRTILVSDGGGRFADDARPSRDWLRHSVRILEIVDHQVRSLRVRQLIDAYRRGSRLGAYWGIRGDAENTGVPGALACPLARTAVLADTPTRLAELPDATQEGLINWGYASCDVALRRFVNPALPAPTNFPYPAVGVG